MPEKKYWILRLFLLVEYLLLIHFYWYGRYNYRKYYLKENFKKFATTNGSSNLSFDYSHYHIRN